jgi:glycosyltransferase involved in cell wall biosynthesis
MNKSDDGKYLSIIIPFFNEEIVLEKFLNSLLVTIKKITNNFEIVAVDDGSADATWEIISGLSQHTENIVGVRLTKNWGQANAIRAGLSIAKGELNIVMDGDFQDDPEFILQLLKQSHLGHRIIIADRISRPDSRFYKLLHSTFFYIRKKISGENINRRLGNFSLFDAKTRAQILGLKEKNLTLPNSLLWVSASILTIPYVVQKRDLGKSSYTFRSRTLLGFNLLFDNTARFLNTVVFFGFTLMFFAIIFLIYLLLLFVFGHKFFSGWLSLISILLIFAGANLSLLGTLGIYMGKIYAETKSRQNYLIEQISTKS